METGSDPAFSPPLDAIPGENATDAFAHGLHRFLAAPIQDDKKLIIAPASDEVGGPQRTFQRTCHYT